MQRTLDRWERETARAAAAERRARADMAAAHRHAIEALIDQGLSVSHVANLLGLSRQWVARMRGETGR